MMARAAVGTDAASTSHKVTHQLASHHWVASDQASGVNGVAVPLLHIAEAESSQRAAATRIARMTARARRMYARKRVGLMSGPQFG